MNPIVFLIIYAIIAIIVCVIVNHFYKNKNDIDCVAIGATWPIVTIVFICCLPFIIIDYIKDVWHNNFSKEAKEFKKENSRKIVEEALFDLRR